MLQIINFLLPLSNDVATIRDNRESFIITKNFELAIRLNNLSRLTNFSIQDLNLSKIDDLVRFTTIDGDVIKRKQNYLVRCLFAMMANSFFHASDSTDVTVYGRLERACYIFGIINKFKGPISWSKLGMFTEGTGGVILSSLREIDGYAYKFGPPMKGEDGTNHYEFISEISFRFGGFMELK